MKKVENLKFIPTNEQPYYMVICRGGITKTYQKDLALELANARENKGLRVQVFESVKINNGFDTLNCIYYTGCPKKIVEE